MGRLIPIGGVLADWVIAHAGGAAYTSQPTKAPELQGTNLRHSTTFCDAQASTRVIPGFYFSRQGREAILGFQEALRLDQNFNCSPGQKDGVAAGSEQSLQDVVDETETARIQYNLVVEFNHSEQFQTTPQTNKQTNKQTKAVCAILFEYLLSA